MRKCGRTRARDVSIAKAWITMATDMHSEYVMLFFGNNGFMNVPQCIMFSIFPAHTDVAVHLCTRLKIPLLY